MQFSGETRSYEMWCRGLDDVEEDGHENGNGNGKGY
jgi:hypothetical protein